MYIFRGAGTGGGGAEGAISSSNLILRGIRPLRNVITYFILSLKVGGEQSDKIEGASKNSLSVFSPSSLTT